MPAKKTSTTGKKSRAAASGSKKTSRAAGAKSVHSSKGAARKKGRGGKAAGASRPAWLLRSVLVLAVGVALGGAIVLAALRREATDTVRLRLDGQVWSTPGRVYSAPIQVWAGLKMEPGDLADYLRAAGYTEVAKVQRPGDFKAGRDALVISSAPQDGPGWRVKGGEVLISFSGGRVSSVSPSSPAVLAPAVMATLAGPSAERRRMVALDAIPEHMKNAVLVMEDQRFYTHPGLSLGGVLRAMVVNLVAGELVQGGSTLTQQLAKNLFLSPDRTFARKVREAFLALAIEEQLGKDEILALYLNGIYLGQAGGQAIHGVAEAATVYFGKPVERLSPAECAMLAGIIPAPNAYSPLGHPERAKERRDLVLQTMAREGLLSREEAERWQASELEIKPTAIYRMASWAVDPAVERAEATLGAGSVTQRGLQVWTSISLPLQRLAEQALAEGLAEVEARYSKAVGAQAALVVLRASTGEVLAVVGGRDYASSSFNRAVHAQRQVGSVVKPLTLALALDKTSGLSLATRLEDAPLERRSGGRTWRPTNYDGMWQGSVSVRDAIVHSRNIPCIHLAEAVGLQRLERFLQQVGLEQATDYPSVALGAFEAAPLQVAGAYTLFPAGGMYSAPTMLNAVQDAQGAPLFREEAQRQQVCSKRTATLARRVLEDVMEHGTGEPARDYGITGGVGGKTGTTDNGRDAWFVGYSSDLVVAVWVGFDRKRTLGLSGAQAALPIWARFMVGSGTAKGRPDETDGLVEATVCVESGALATSACPETASEWFDRDHLPTGTCPLHGGSGAEGAGAPEGAPAAPEDETREGLIQRLRQSVRKRKGQ